MRDEDQRPLQSAAADPPKTVSEALAESGLGAYIQWVTEAKLDWDIAEHLQPADLYGVFGKEVPFGDCVRIVSAIKAAASSQRDSPSTEITMPVKQGLWTLPAMQIAAGESNGDLVDRQSNWADIGAVLATLFLSIFLDQDRSEVDDCKAFWTPVSCQRLVVAQNVMRTIGIVFTATGTIYFWAVVAQLQLVDHDMLVQSLRSNWSSWTSFATGTSLMGVYFFCECFSLHEMVGSRNWLDVVSSHACMVGYLWACGVSLSLVKRLTGGSWLESFVYFIGSMSGFGFLRPVDPSFQLIEPGMRAVAVAA